MRTAIVSTYPPRACGIGTFAADVRAALLGVDGIDRVEKVVVVNEPSRPQRPGLVATIAQAVRGDYVRAARILARLDVDVVLLQHEYGIFGGVDGRYVVSLAEELSQPLVVTLHTVLSEPTAHQAEVLAALCRQAERVIVMTETARRLLVESDACAAEKIRVVPHGAPTVLARRAAEYAVERAGADGASTRGTYDAAGERFLLSTFGLLSAGKGLETVIEALPSIVERHPEVLYVVAGRTHPDVTHREGERYRLTLEQAVLDLGLENHVEFDDRFLTVEEIADLLAATDVFVTPYRGREQITSGALTFGIAAGCGVVSTPYWYARDMLASGAGEIVPFADPAALADAVCRYIEEPERLAAARAEARRIGARLAWPSVAEATASVLREAVQLAPRRRSLARLDPRLVSMRRDHLLTLVDDVGIVQHANGVIPSRESGYCVDDVARLAVVALELARRGDEQVWTSIVYRSLAFLQDATDPQTGMRNFMGYDRRWLDDPHVGDHVGRSVWALGEILSTAWVPAVVGPTRRLLDAIVGTLGPETSLRTGAYAVLGLARLDPDRLQPAALLLLERVVDQLAEAYETHASVEWRWFEDALGYDNARLPHALIVGGAALDRDDLTETGLDALRWLGDESGLAEGTLRLTGHHGRRRTEPAPGGGDEQPLDASAFVSAELAAFSVTGDPEHAMRAQRAFDWFLGRNRLHLPLYDFATGGCSDGLGEEATNDNQGAESTLALHRAALLLDAAGLPAVLRQRTRAAATA
ncbi:Glycosyl transferases group 1 [Gaiella occulta]|uniref:Glycosyl transferases group 1 n=1 Tax=Gaiella occulta TaxID=1002870 RepID=A0A7M2Z0U9_9ACTN|nr:glycosyltransferase [Gaiella occulta]RDI75441.1 Glycosyl transferases group 1 [Gaiella occulta]